MNILFYRYNSIYEPDMINIFEQLHNQVFSITQQMEGTIRDDECVELISDALKQASYNFVFTVNFFPVISEVCNIFCIPYVSWIVDCPVMELYSHSIRNQCNRIFLFDYALYEEFSSQNPGRIFYLPLGANYLRLDPLIASISEEEQKRFSSDVSFIGSLYTEKCPYNLLKEDSSYLKGYLDGLIEAQLKVYGYNFLEEHLTDEIIENFKARVPFYQFPDKAVKNDRAALAHLFLGNKVTEQERLRLLKAVSEQYSLDLYTGSDTSALPLANKKGLAKSMTEMPKIFHLSKINLNFTSKPIRTGLPLRIWDILGAGGFLLTGFQSELLDYFEIGSDLEVWTCEEELIEKIGFYLQHEEERKRIAKNGYEKAKNHYSMKDKVRQLLSQV